MSVDIASIKIYQAQLNQVDEVLATNPPNADELLQLKSELEELISMTLMLAAESADEPNDQSAGVAEPRAAAQQTRRGKTQWKVGQACEAFKSKDNAYKVGVIREIFDNGSCKVAFGSRCTEVIQLDSLRKSNFHPEKERKRLKALKYEEKLKKEDEVSQACRKAWQGFSKKMSKTGSMTKRSIFSTTDSFGGKVGVGTCGISGKPMTQTSERVMLRKKGR